MLPLENIRILDFSRLAPGPFCTMVLADFGAQVIRVEPPGGVTRQKDAPAPVRQQPSPEEMRRAAYSATNRNKRCIALNMKDPRAVKIVHQMAPSMDVVVEGFRPGVVDRLGIGYEQLSKLNPRLVYCSISGYGQTGPYRDMPGHDINYISIAGALASLGNRQGELTIPHNLLADYAAGGLESAFAIMAALWARQRDGAGQYIDMSMTDGVLYLLAPMAGSYFGGGRPPRPGAELLNGGAFVYNVYRTKDGKYVSLGALEAWFWENLCKALGRDDLASMQLARGEDRKRIETWLRETFASRTADEWFEFFRSRDVPLTKVLSMDEVVQDPHIRAREMVVEIPGPDGKPVPHINAGPKLSRTPAKMRSPGVPIGYNTWEVLREFGYDDRALEELAREQVIS